MGGMRGICAWASGTGRVKGQLVAKMGWVGGIIGLFKMMVGTFPATNVHERVRGTGGRGSPESGGGASGRGSSREEGQGGAGRGERAQGMAGVCGAVLFV